MNLEEVSGRWEIDLPAMLDLAAAPDLQGTILEALARKSDRGVLLKAQMVERMSTACVQVILAAAKATPDGVRRRVVVEAPSEVFSSAFAQLGLADDLANMI